MNISPHILTLTAARHVGVALLVMLCGAVMPPGELAAGQPDAARSMAVGFADLDLARASDIGILYARIQEAARRVCGDRDSIMRLYLQVERARGDCHRQAVADAVARLRRPALTALHRAATTSP